MSFLLNSLGNSSSVIPSTVKREPLPEGSVVETGYFTDELGWISDSSALTAGMEPFYRETGVQPYLYLFDNIDGNYNPSDAQVEAFAYSVYDPVSYTHLDVYKRQRLLPLPCRLPARNGALLRALHAADRRNAARLLD